MLAMSKLADILGSYQPALSAGEPPMRLVDMTGLKGYYDVALDISMAGALERARAIAGTTPSAGVAPEPASAEAIISAALSPLGLKLEQRKAAMDQLVVDHVEKIPAEE